MKTTFCYTLCCMAVLLCAGASAQSYTQFQNFPDPAIYAVVGTGLPDGRVVVWNGDGVYAQVFVGGDSFREVASGYAGDPAFIDLSPDGHTLLLGGGYNGMLYLLDMDNPVDYTTGSEVFNVGHYSGAFLTGDLVVLDRGKGDWQNDEIGIVDLSADPIAYKAIMDKPASGDVGAGSAAGSAMLALDASRTTLYATEYLYDSSFWFTVGAQLKSIAVADLVSAHASSSTLDWVTDATAIGADLDFGASGPIAVTNDGNLLIGDFWIDGLQVVDPGTATIVETLSPNGLGMGTYGAIYNRYTDDIIVLNNGADAYIAEGGVQPVPVASGLGLIALAGALTVLGRRRLSR